MVAETKHVTVMLRICVYVQLYTYVRVCVCIYI